jgi:hypothetical protein
MISVNWTECGYGSGSGTLPTSQTARSGMVRFRGGTRIR